MFCSPVFCSSLNKSFPEPQTPITTTMDVFRIFRPSGGVSLELSAYPGIKSLVILPWHPCADIVLVQNAKRTGPKSGGPKFDGHSSTCGVSCPPPRA